MSAVFVSWSGGKDSCLAAHRTVAGGGTIRYLANTVTEDGRRSRSHGLSAGVLRVQSRALGVPLVQQPTGADDYEDRFKAMLRVFKQEGVEGGVFGDIDFNEHRQWVERVCREVGVTPHLPLWGESQDRVMRDFIALGFEAVVVATRADVLGEEWLGRRVDLDFLEELTVMGKTREITPCGEAGEYHTLVVNGPLFQQRLEIMESHTVRREGHWFLEIAKVELRDK